MVLDIILFAVGLAAIVKSADILVNSSTSLARKLKIPAFIVGIVIVAFGTSAPELVIGIMSGVTKTNELTLGNVIGSGFSNIAMILGLCAAIMPLKTDDSVAKREIPILIAVELLLFGLLFFDKRLSLIDGIILVTCFAAFMVYIIIKTKNEQQGETCGAAAPEGAPLPESAGAGGGSMPISGKPDECSVQACGALQSAGGLKTEAAESQERWIKIIPMLVLSIAGLFIGGKLTVDCSSSIALGLGLSETFIGITIVAVATTLPELVASLTAVRKKEAGIVLGNCIGSNIFNILLVTGGSAIINPITFGGSPTIDFCLLIFLTVLVFAVVLARKRVSRRMGIVLLSSYALYMAYKILSITALSGII